MLKRHTNRIVGAVFGLIFALMVSLLCRVNLFEKFEWISYDYRIRLRGKRFTSPHIVLIGITSDCLKRKHCGPVPWDRAKIWAPAVKRIHEAGAKVIAFDVFFPEPRAGDGAFAQAIKEAGNVILPVHAPVELDRRAVHKGSIALLKTFKFIGEKCR